MDTGIYSSYRRKIERERESSSGAKGRIPPLFRAGGDVFTSRHGVPSKKGVPAKSPTRCKPLSLWHHSMLMRHQCKNPPPMGEEWDQRASLSQPCTCPQDPACSRGVDPVGGRELSVWKVEFGGLDVAEPPATQHPPETLNHLPQTHLCASTLWGR